MTVPTMTTIGGIAVDSSDPCQMKSALELLRLRFISGEQVEELSIQSPTTRETVIFSKANLASLDAEIARYSDACLRKCGKAVPTRRWRFRY